MNNQPRTSCKYLQQHDKYVWLVYANLDEEVFTMSKLLEILNVLEGKIYKLDFPKNIGSLIDQPYWQEL